MVCESRPLLNGEHFLGPDHNVFQKRNCSLWPKIHIATNLKESTGAEWNKLQTKRSLWQVHGQSQNGTFWKQAQRMKWNMRPLQDRELGSARTQMDGSLSCCMIHALKEHLSACLPDYPIHSFPYERTFNDLRLYVLLTLSLYERRLWCEPRSRERTSNSKLFRNRQ